MPYPWECSDCNWLDPNDQKWGEHYCKKLRQYVRADSPSCRYLDKKSSNSGGCYLTTAMCDILGFEDNCDVLETLRAFRDNYMKENEECTLLLKDYDNVGPKIVECLNEDDNKIETAVTMLDFYIMPAIEYISVCDFDAAIDVYKNMTLGLMRYYELDVNMLSYVNDDEPTPSKGHQRKIKY